MMTVHSYRFLGQAPPNSVRTCSHCSPCPTISKNELFALFVVQTVHTILLVRCSNCSVRTVRTSEQRTRLFAVRWTLSWGSKFLEIHPRTIKGGFPWWTKSANEDETIRIDSFRTNHVISGFKVVKSDTGPIFGVISSDQGISHWPSVTDRQWPTLWRNYSMITTYFIKSDYCF